MNTLSTSAVARFEDLIRDEVEDKALPSVSYALVDRDGLRASGHVRRSDLGHEMNDGTQFRIGSITKTFTAICLMQLVEEGSIDLDADIASYIPNFEPVNPFAGEESGPFGPQVSARKLMSHTAGIVREPKSGHYLDKDRPSLTATVDELATSTLKNDPSAGIFSYSNAGIAIVGSIIERVTGRPFAETLQQRILEPLHMDSSSIAMTPAIQEKLARADMWTIDGDQPAPVFDLGSAPAGNIYSTAGDMAKYVQCLLRGGFTTDGQAIVSPRSLGQMWEMHGQRLQGATFKGYGLGFGLGELDGWKAVGHGGAVYGYATQMTLLPVAGFGIVTFATLDFANQIAARLANDGLRTILAENGMGKPLSAPPRPGKVTQEHLGRLPGRYQENDGAENVEVRTANGRLFIMGDGVPLEIKPTQGSDFVIDGRIYAHDADYAHMTLFFPGEGQLRWKGKSWTRIAETIEMPPSAEIGPHLGTYGPDFNPTYLIHSGGKLKCLIEFFCTHDCERMEDGTYRMQGRLYPDETLELGAVNDSGETGIRVGPMFLKRRA